MTSSNSTAPSPGPTIPVDHMPENMRLRATEINTYMREMPRLLREGGEGRYALIGGDHVVGLWDTHADAVEAGYERFGSDGQFIAQRIDSRYYERFLTLVSQPYRAGA